MVTQFVVIYVELIEIWWKNITSFECRINPLDFTNYLKIRRVSYDEILEFRRSFF